MLTHYAKALATPSSVCFILPQGVFKVNKIFANSLLILLCHYSKQFYKSGGFHRNKKIGYLLLFLGVDNGIRLHLHFSGEKCKLRFRSVKPSRATVRRTGTRFVKDGFPGCTAPKPPLCKGRWAAKKRLGGVVNPSVKNQRFLPTPLAQGILFSVIPHSTTPPAKAGGE